MIKIEISPLDQKDILDLLDYALKKKKEDTDKEAYPKYWQIRIPQIKSVINGYEPYENIVQSSLGGFIKNISKWDDKEETKQFINIFLSKLFLKYSSPFIVLSIISIAKAIPKVNKAPRSAPTIA